MTTWPASSHTNPEPEPSGVSPARRVKGSTIRVDVVIATTLSRAARNTAMVRASADAASAETGRVAAGGAAGGVEVWRPAMKATMSIRARITPTRLARMIPPGFGVVAARTRARSTRKTVL